MGLLGLPGLLYRETLVHSFLAVHPKLKQERAEKRIHNHR